MVPKLHAVGVTEEIKVRKHPMYALASCVDGVHGSRDFLVLSLRSGASHVSGLFVRRS